SVDQRSAGSNTIAPFRPFLSKSPPVFSVSLKNQRSGKRNLVTAAQIEPSGEVTPRTALPYPKEGANDRRNADLPVKTGPASCFSRSLSRPVGAGAFEIGHEDLRPFPFGRGSRCLLLHARLPRSRLPRAPQSQVLRGRSVETRTGKCSDADDRQVRRGPRGRPRQSDFMVGLRNITRRVKAPLKGRAPVRQ